MDIAGIKANSSCRKSKRRTDWMRRFSLRTTTIIDHRRNCKENIRTESGGKDARTSTLCIQACSRYCGSQATFAQQGKRKETCRFASSVSCALISFLSDISKSADIRRSASFCSRVFCRSCGGSDAHSDRGIERRF